MKNSFDLLEQNTIHCKYESTNKTSKFRKQELLPKEWHCFVVNLKSDDIKIPLSSSFLFFLSLSLTLSLSYQLLIIFPSLSILSKWSVTFGIIFPFVLVLVHENWLTNVDITCCSSFVFIVKFNNAEVSFCQILIGEKIEYRYRLFLMVIKRLIQHILYINTHFIFQTRIRRINSFFLV